MAFIPNQNRSVFNLDSPEHAALPPGTGNLGTFGLHAAGPGAIPGQIYSFSGNALPAWMGGGNAAHLAMTAGWPQPKFTPTPANPAPNVGVFFGTPGTGLTPFTGTLDESLAAVQKSKTTAPNTGIVNSAMGPATAGIPNYQGMLEWLQQLNAPGIEPEEPIYGGGVIRGPTWS